MVIQSPEAEEEVLGVLGKGGVQNVQRRLNLAGVGGDLGGAAGVGTAGLGLLTQKNPDVVLLLQGIGGLAQLGQGGIQLRFFLQNGSVHIAGPRDFLAGGTGGEVHGLGIQHDGVEVVALFIKAHDKLFVMEPNGAEGTVDITVVVQIHHGALLQVQQAGVTGLVIVRSEAAHQQVGAGHDGPAHLIVTDFVGGDALDAVAGEGAAVDVHAVGGVIHGNAVEGITGSPHIGQLSRQQTQATPLGINHSQGAIVGVVVGIDSGNQQIFGGVDAHKTLQPQFLLQREPSPLGGGGFHMAKDAAVHVIILAPVVGEEAIGIGNAEAALLRKAGIIHNNLPGVGVGDEDGAIGELLGHQLQRGVVIHLGEDLVTVDVQ